MTDQEQRAQDVEAVRAVLRRYMSSLPAREADLADLIAAAREEGRREGAEQALRLAAASPDELHLCHTEHTTSPRGLTGRLTS